MYLTSSFPSNVNCFCFEGQKIISVAMEVGLIKQVFEFGNGVHLSAQERGDILGKVYSLWWALQTLQFSSFYKLALQTLPIIKSYGLFGKLYSFWSVLQDAHRGCGFFRALKNTIKREITATNKYYRLYNSDNF